MKPLERAYNLSGTGHSLVPLRCFHARHKDATIARKRSTLRPLNVVEAKLLSFLVV